VDFDEVGDAGLGSVLAAEASESRGLERIDRRVPHSPRARGVREQAVDDVKRGEAVGQPDLDSVGSAFALDPAPEGLTLGGRDRNRKQRVLVPARVDDHACRGEPLDHGFQHALPRPLRDGTLRSQRDYCSYSNCFVCS